MLIDSHCHLNRLDGGQTDEGLDRVLAQAAEAGVTHILSICVDLAEFSRMVEIAQRYPNVKVSAGVHPTEAVQQEPCAEELVALVEANREYVIAIGETGLDYYREYDKALQKARFQAHIDAAIETDLPLIVHTRTAKADTLEMLRMGVQRGLRGVLHCFTEDWPMAEAALAFGFYISISGIVTFKNAESLRDVAMRIPMDRLLIETDSPYLAPVPHRGKQNAPAYVAIVADYLSNLRGISAEALCRQTSENVQRLFAWPGAENP